MIWSMVDIKKILKISLFFRCFFIFLFIHLSLITFIQFSFQFSRQLIYSLQLHLSSTYSISQIFFCEKYVNFWSFRAKLIFHSLWIYRIILDYWFCLYYRFIIDSLFFSQYLFSKHLFIDIFSVHKVLKFIIILLIISSFIKYK